ncbi:thiol peroxidase, atypical 2-Cys peroxiredoxin [Desemzia incerta]|uniref:Thiol peroxidase, atypical 2-Cys peroxiredoxin n=1 Tax=Desemzia incerta TaxID=82801 RepID=A0A1I5VTV0_9LACT|nr:thiol peroxidase [Desemzia incerta]SFQ10881.1 thiol peroxidase, atypical 2-Cys peroxiredoxin [Desemzia incerta]
MEITRKGTPYQLEGIQPAVGEKAPNFSLSNLNGDQVSLADFTNEVIVISVIPDIDTRVCAQQTRAFNEKVSKIEGVQLLTISNNTEDQQRNWCAGEGLEMEMLHDTSLTFAQAYGLYMPGLKKLARSVFVIDRKGTIVYQEIVPEMVDEPDYEAVIEAAKSAR